MIADVSDSPGPSVLAFPEAATPRHLRLQASQLQQQAWRDPSPEPAVPGPIHDPALAPLSLLLIQDDTVLATLDILTKEIEHAGRRWRAAGLSAVVTRNDLRGKGFGRLLVRQATDHIGRDGADIGLFTCDRPLLAFYENAGWEHLPGTVLVGGTPAEPFPSDASGFDKVTMGAFLSPAGIAGRTEFVSARIALHCGPIDKLW